MSHCQEMKSYLITIDRAVVAAAAACGFGVPGDSVQFVAPDQAIRYLESGAVLTSAESDLLSLCKAHKDAGIVMLLADD